MADTQSVFRQLGELPPEMLARVLTLFIYQVWQRQELGQIELTEQQKKSLPLSGNGQAYKEE